MRPCLMSRSSTMRPPPRSRSTRFVTRLLAELAQPASASNTLAARLGLARQKVNYHLRALELHGLVELVAERRKWAT